MKKITDIMIRGIVLVFIMFLSRNLKNYLLIRFDIESVVNITSSFRRLHLLMAFAFILLLFFAYNKKTILRYRPDNLSLRKVLPWLIVAYVPFVLYYVLNAWINTYGLTYVPVFQILQILGLLLLALYVLLLFIALFGYTYLKKLIKNYYRQLYFFVPAYIIASIAFILFQKTWYFFSLMVVKILNFLFGLFYNSTVSYAGDSPLLAVDNFKVLIGPPCSGIDSMLLFTAFFAVLYALDKETIDIKRYAIAFIIGFLGVILVNILRLFLLILVGVHISPDLAVGLFHTQAGWLLFVIYFLLFYYLVNRFIKK